MELNARRTDLHYCTFQVGYELKLFLSSLLNVYVMLYTESHCESAQVTKNIKQGHTTIVRNHYITTISCYTLEQKSMVQCSLATPKS